MFIADDSIPAPVIACEPFLSAPYSAAFWDKKTATPAQGLLFRKNQNQYLRNRS
jgi:hypothetical protein